MPAIAHIVEKIIEEKPFLQEALSKGVINNAALAEQLTPIIEKELKKKVKFSAVNMAIRRLAEKLQKTFVTKVKFDEDTDITIKSDLVEITLYKNSNVLSKLNKVYSLVDIRKGNFLTITQGMYEVMIITNKKYLRRMEKLFSESDKKKVIRRLSSLMVSIPEKSVETLGLFYLVTRALNWENINIVDIVSTYTEMTFIVDEDDTSRSFNVLKSLISSNV